MKSHPTQGAHAAVLEVAVDNAAARALYHQVGFAEVGRREAYYRRPGGVRVDACLLRQSPPDQCTRMRNR